MDRRAFLMAGAACAASCGQAAAPKQQSAIRSDRFFEQLRNSLGKGARLGVMAVSASGKTIAFDAYSRYAMCSTFKLPLAAFVLSLAEKGALGLTETVRFSAGDPLDNSPVVEANFKLGSLPIETLVAAIVQRSDNSAANLLLQRVGGPDALTRFVRACGDRMTRLDRSEMELNSNIPGDRRDTTTPAEFAELTRKLVLGNVLSPASRERLIGWLRTSVPWPDRLRAGIPPGWSTGHKPGTGRGGANNDVAVAWPPRAAPIVIASFISGGSADVAARNAVHREVGRHVAALLG